MVLRRRGGCRRSVGLGAVSSAWSVWLTFVSRPSRPREFWCGTIRQAAVG